MTSIGERFGLLPPAEFEVTDCDHGLRVTRTSIFTMRRNTMELPITREQLSRWRGGGILIQNAFPQLTVEQREFLISGATQQEWDEHVPKDEDEDEEDEPA